MWQPGSLEPNPFRGTEYSTNCLFEKSESYDCPIIKVERLGENEIQNDLIYLEDCAVCCVNTGKICFQTLTRRVLSDTVNGCVALRWLPCRVKTVGTLDDNVSVLAQAEAPLENGKVSPHTP